jgi:hypothetical protein
MGYNPSKSVWLNPDIEYIFDQDIIEYDMSDAGFSLIKQYHLLPDDKIRELTKLGKGIDRHIKVGMYQKEDKEFSKALMDKFAEIRTIFIAENNLTDNDIISVKKDAIFTIGECKKLKFGSIIFNPKNRYSSYVRFPEINNLEIYYSNDGVDIKGMSDESVNRHRLYMLGFIIKMIQMLESKNSRIRKYLMNFIQDYKFGNLEDGYYLEFNNKSRDMNPLFNYQKIIIRFLQIVMKEI